MNGRVADRYEIGHHLEGLIATETTLATAKALALHWAKGNNGYPDAVRQVRIYDAMARVNQTTKWGYDPEHDQWNCIEIRLP